MLHVSWTPRIDEIVVHTALFIGVIPIVSAGSLPTGGSAPEQMPSWVTPAAFVILIAVYALIVI